MYQQRLQANSKLFGFIRIFFSFKNLVHRFDFIIFLSFSSRFSVQAMATVIHSRMTLLTVAKPKHVLM